MEVVGEVTASKAGAGVTLAFRLQNGSHVFGSGFEGSYEFPSCAYLNKVLGAIHRRAADPSGGRPLTKWPHRPFAWMRRNCRFVGTVRGSSRGEHKRLLAFAVVPKGAGEILEVSDWAGGETSFNLPIKSLRDIQELL